MYHQGIYGAIAVAAAGCCWRRQNRSKTRVPIITNALIVPVNLAPRCLWVAPSGGGLQARCPSRCRPPPLPDRPEGLSFPFPFVLPQVELEAVRLE